jgi:hypothetical protein
MAAYGMCIYGTRTGTVIDDKGTEVDIERYHVWKSIR